MTLVGVMVKMTNCLATVPSTGTRFAKRFLFEMDRECDHNGYR